MMRFWLAGFVVLAALPNFIAVDTLWPAARLRTEVSNLAFARSRYAQFRSLVGDRVLNRPALVLVIPDPADRHIDYVTNQPGLDADVVFGRFLPGLDASSLSRGPDAPFAGRTVYEFNAATGVLREL